MHERWNAEILDLLFNIIAQSKLSSSFAWTLSKIIVGGMVEMQKIFMTYRKKVTPNECWMWNKSHPRSIRMNKLIVSVDQIWQIQNCWKVLTIYKRNKVELNEKFEWNLREKTRVTWEKRKLSFHSLLYGSSYIVQILN